MLFPIVVCVAAAVGQADESFPLEYRPEKVFEVIPGSALMSVEQFSENRPDWITKEPEYVNTPYYAVLTFGDNESKVVFALDEDDDKARLYMDANSNGDLTDDPEMEAERNVVPEEKRTKILKVWISDYFNGTLPVEYKDGKSGEVTLKFRTYGKICRDIHNIEPALVYWSTCYRTGEVPFGDKVYQVAIKDQVADGRYDTVDGPYNRNDLVFIDLDGDGKFMRRNEGYDINKPFEVDGVTYEIASLAPDGSSISFKESEKEAKVTSLKVGQEAPDFDIPGVGKLSSLRGKVVLIDFWATWCGPCLAEMPNIVKAYDQFKDDGFVVVGVSIDDEGMDDKIKETAKKHNMTWPEVHDHENKIARPYFVSSIPATFLIGPDGKIIAQYIRGEEMLEKVQQEIEKLNKS